VAKERVELYLYSPSSLYGLFYGQLYLYLYLYFYLQEGRAEEGTELLDM